MVNGYVIGAFGGHCDLFNYTGMLVAVKPGVGVISIYAMEGGPAAMPEVDDIMTQSGGKAGIWQGGMGLATDGPRIFFATGKVLRSYTGNWELLFSYGLLHMELG
jgi:iron transport multicopper oxidase